MKKILFLEPFYGGSHQNFADNFRKYSRHSVEIYSLPASIWRWRSRLGAFHFVEKVPSPEEYDYIFCSGMMSLADLKAVWQDRCPPIVLYMHESQLSYPIPNGYTKPNYHAIQQEISNIVVADKVIINSHFHKNAFWENLISYLEKYPEAPPSWLLSSMQNKMRVIYPGCDLPPRNEREANETPIILWNHRWQFDKVPEDFYRVMCELEKEDIPFQLVLLGEAPEYVPKCFKKAKEIWADKILHFGFVESRAEYRRWLEKSDIVVSTAIQENFGISVVEATYFGAFPFLPNRLSYPEILPSVYHSSCLYNDLTDLKEKLASFIQQGKKEDELNEYFAKYSWKNLIEDYDKLFEL